MVNSPYEASYQNTYDEVYRCAFGHSPPRDLIRGGKRKATGGKAVASGGYGCVLRPAVPCRGKGQERPKGQITKLMLNTKAKEEMEEVNKAKRLLSKIPDYEKYFAVTGYTKCVPAQLTAEDIDGFKSKCRGPLKFLYNPDLEPTERDVNKFVKQEKIMALNSPDLGLDLTDVFENMFGIEKPSNASTIKQLLRFNNQISQLLENGVSKMANIDFYHSDVKPQNIMTDYDSSNPEKSFTYMKLIDFGLALPHKADYKDVNSVFLFNTPPSSFLFDPMFTDSLNRKLERTFDSQTGKINASSFRKQIHSLVSYRLTKGWSHADLLIHMIRYNKQPKELSYSEGLEEAINIVADYCENVVLSNLTQGSPPKFDLKQYFNDTFRFNLDVWGLLTVFLYVCDNARNTPGRMAKRIHQLYWDKLVWQYLYGKRANDEYAKGRLPVAQILESIKSVSAALEQMVPKNARQKQGKAKTRRVTISSSSKGKGTQKKALKVSKLGSASVRSVLPSRYNTRGKYVRSRCPNGYRRHKTMKSKCVKTSQTQSRTHSSVDSRPVVVKLSGKRCPSGYKKHSTQKGYCVKK